MRSPGREIKIRKAEGLGPPTFSLWVEDEPTKEEKDLELQDKSQRELCPKAAGREASSRQERKCCWEVED